MSSDAVAPTRVKICGITRVQDALAAAQAGADFLGYVFHPKSSRNMEAGAVAAIVAEVRRQFSAIAHVGVMVNPSAEEARTLRDAADLDFCQLHGDESPATVAELKEAGVRVVKALRFGPNSPAVDWKEFSADYFLCDTFDPGAAGGTGRQFDHRLLPPDLPRPRIFLAGGLAPENIGGVVAQVRPFAVDVSSGVEASPGRKDKALVAAFIQHAKQQG